MMSIDGVGGVAKGRFKLRANRTGTKIRLFFSILQELPEFFA